jgi:hypothetical protein
MSTDEREAFEALKMRLIHEFCYMHECSLGNGVMCNGDDFVRAIEKAWQARAALGAGEPDKVVKVCIGMANRYDEDIEGCSADELLRYEEGITCCFRLAYFFRYGQMPLKGDAWSSEFAALAKRLPRNDEVRTEYANALPDPPKAAEPAQSPEEETSADPYR